LKIQILLLLSEVVKIDSAGNLGIGDDPISNLQVNDNNKGNYFGSKTFTLSSSDTNALTIVMPDDTSCYVKVFINGLWDASHGPVNYYADFIISNNANLTDPGTYTDSNNTYNGTVVATILDEPSPDTYIIQFRIDSDDSVGSISANLVYHAMGSITSIS
jgi:hypothetical protein